MCFVLVRNKHLNTSKKTEKTKEIKKQHGNDIFIKILDTYINVKPGLKELLVLLGNIYYT